MSKQKFYLTTPIYYVNARPHIGHAYTTLVADTIARRHRLLGDDTFFLTGTDEHGQKIERSAAAAGIPPQQFTDQVSAEFRNLWDRMGLTYDDYIRTTEPRHQQGAQRLFAILYERGQIYLSSYTGNYSVGEEIFVEGPPGVLGPDGKPTETVTEENFFFRLSEYQLPLIDLIESDTLLIQPESRKNEVLSFLRGPVSAHLASKAATEEAEKVGHAAAISSIISSEVSSFGTIALGESSFAALDIGRAAAESVEEAAEVEAAKRPHAAKDASGAGSSVIAYSALGNPYVVGNLRDLSVSRSSFTWGIPVPEPAASETKQKHVIYVWLDALANYMTAVGYGSDKPEDIAKFDHYWPADVHIMAKEITRQHCIYWPAFLLAAGLPLPKAVTAHGWLLFDDSKMSKSKGNIVRTETILDAFGTEVYGKQFPDSTRQEQDLFASDVIRYYLLREIPFGQDGSFSFDAIITRYRADLQNGYGNLVSRVLNMIHQYFGGNVPQPTVAVLSGVDHELRSLFPVDAGAATVNFRVEAKACLSLYDQYFAEQNFAMALSVVWMYITKLDGFITKNAPWKLSKLNDEPSKNKLVAVLYIAAESIRIITGLVYPFIPRAASKVWEQLGLGSLEEAARRGELAELTWGYKFEHALGPLYGVFPQADKGLAQIMTDMENPNTPAPSKLVDEKTTHTAPVPTDPTHPGAPPRTSDLAGAVPGTSVGGSHAISTERPGTPPHTEAPASGPFAASAAGSATPDTPQIAIDDFVKIDLRVAQIIVAERIPKADKLLRLEVDLGYEKRQILSGIAEWYTPEELIGRRIVVIANLAPRKMRGLESHGMLLAASAGENGKPVLATFGEEIALGSRLK